MADSANVQKPLRVLVSEGNSTSAREAVTMLGLSGHLVEVCDPSPWCLARFSRFIQKFHRCPGLRDDPDGFLRFVEELLAARHFDVLLPIHEQGFLFARVQERLGDRAGLALPGFASYRAAHSKAEFSRLLDDSSTSLLIDCNPRLVEPMNAYLAGVDLVGLLLRVSQGEVPAALPQSRAGVRTHLAIQVLLGCASRGGTRRDILCECWRLLTGRGPYADSAEELTPVRLDWISAVPLAMTAILLLLAPKLAIMLARGGWGAHLLDLRGIGLIESEDFR